MSKFTGKVVVVTSSSEGLGASIALAFAKEVAKLTIIAENREQLSQTGNKCREFGCEVLEISTDPTRPENLKAIAEKTVEMFGGIDILVNNAPTPAFIKPVAWYTEQEYDFLFDTSLKVPFFLSKFTLPHLKKSKGCITNISGAVSMRNFPSLVTICMCQNALDHFTRGLAAECASFGVRINSINPGMIYNDSNKGKGTANTHLNARFAEMQHLGLVGSDEITNTILSMCSSPRMTGSSVVIEGGMLVTSPN